VPTLVDIHTKYRPKQQMHGVRFLLISNSHVANIMKLAVCVPNHCYRLVVWSDLQQGTYASQ